MWIDRFDCWELRVRVRVQSNLTHFWIIFPFHTSWKHQNTFGFLISTFDFLMFSRGMKWEHWPEMWREEGWKSSWTSSVKFASKVKCDQGALWQKSRSAFFILGIWITMWWNSSSSSTTHKPGNQMTAPCKSNYCYANQITGFYMKCNLGLKCVKWRYSICLLQDCMSQFSSLSNIFLFSYLKFAFIFISFSFAFLYHKYMY